eukprot:gene13195-15589_t
MQPPQAFYLKIHLRAALNQCIVRCDRYSLLWYLQTTRTQALWQSYEPMPLVLRLNPVLKPEEVERASNADDFSQQRESCIGPTLVSQDLRQEQAHNQGGMATSIVSILSETVVERLLPMRSRWDLEEHAWLRSLIQKDQLGRDRSKIYDANRVATFLRQQDALWLQMRATMFTARYGVMFDSLRGVPMNIQDALRLATSEKRYQHLPTYRHYSHHSSATSIFTHRERTSFPLAGNQSCPVPWGVHYLSIKAFVMTFSSMIVGIFLVPCACEVGERDEQWWICTWPQTFTLALLFALQFVYLAVWWPFASTFQQVVEMLGCLCNVLITSLTFIAWFLPTQTPEREGIADIIVWLTRGIYLE